MLASNPVPYPNGRQDAITHEEGPNLLLGLQSKVNDTIQSKQGAKTCLFDFACAKY